MTSSQQMDCTAGSQNQEFYNAICCQIGLENKVDEPRTHSENFFMVGKSSGDNYQFFKSYEKVLIKSKSSYQ